MVATIEHIEKVIATYAQATEANWRMSTRQDSVVLLTAAEADEVMITADLHGHRANFNAIKKIADLENHPRRHLVMQEVCHGGPTYASNGGCMSHTMLEDVAELKVAYPSRAHFLMSNHELSELTDYPILKDQKMLNLMFRTGLQAMYGPATEKVREAYLAFLRSLPLAVWLSGGIFVSHSLPENVDQRGFNTGLFRRQLEPSDLLERSDLFNLVWGRDYRSENAEAFARAVNAKVLIHGHDPCPEGYRVPNKWQIILDCSGRRSAYVILPTNTELSHAEIVQRIRPLP